MGMRRIRIHLTGFFKFACFDAVAARDKTSFSAGATLCSEAAAAMTMCGKNRDSMQIKDFEARNGCA